MLYKGEKKMSKVKIERHPRYEWQCPKCSAQNLYFTPKTDTKCSICGESIEIENRKQIKIEILQNRGVECLLVNGDRVSGPKLLGGGTVTKSFAIDESMLNRALFAI